MIQPASLEELASLVEKEGKKVFLFVADWCGDCRYIYPALPEIEETNPEFTFIRVDRDQYVFYNLRLVDFIKFNRNL